MTVLEAVEKASVLKAMNQAVTRRFVEEDVGIQEIPGQNRWGYVDLNHGPLPYQSVDLTVLVALFGL